MSTCARCIVDGGASGHYEREQFYHYMKHKAAIQASMPLYLNDGEKSLNPNVGAAKLCEYTVSELSEVKADATAGGGGGGSCISFTIRQRINVARRCHPVGGASFRITIDGGGLEVCCVKDLFNGEYEVACPRRAVDELYDSGCARIVVKLGYEHFGAFVNRAKRLQNGTLLSEGNHQDSGGYHVPLHLKGKASSPPLRSIHFVGESHINFIADCFAMAHEAVGHVRWADYATSAHRMEPVDPQHPYDGAIAEGLDGGIEFTRVWSSCQERPEGCWAAPNPSTRVYDVPQNRTSTFVRRCWQWNRSFAPHPLVCKHSGQGLFRVAMTLRLMLADQEALVQSNKTQPWTAADVIVMLGGTWDAMNEGSLEQHLAHDVPPFLDALRALRRSPATKGARLIYISLVPNPDAMQTTGFRSAWAHAAAAAHTREALQMAPGSGDENTPLDVRVIDGVAATLPRLEASIDGLHFLRRPFHTTQMNIPKQYPKTNAWTVPWDKEWKHRPTTCLGDAGMVIARALRDEIEQG